MGYAPCVALLCSPCSEDRAALASLFQSLGVTLVPAHNVTTASDLLRTGHFSLALIDLDCDPAWTETIERLRSLDPELTVIVYSRLPDEHRWIDALEAGATDFISKPFSKPELGWVLETALHLEARFRPSREPSAA